MLARFFFPPLFFFFSFLPPSFPLTCVALSSEDDRDYGWKGGGNGGDEDQLARGERMFGLQLALMVRCGTPFHPEIETGTQG